MKIRTAILLLLATLVIAACGNKGPLVLPDEGDAAAYEDDIVDDDGSVDADADADADADLDVDAEADDIDPPSAGTPRDDDGR